MFRAEVVQDKTRVDVVSIILEDYANIAAELALCLDSTDRVVEQIACPESQLLLKRQRYFLKRLKSSML